MMVCHMAWNQRGVMGWPSAFGSYRRYLRRGVQGAFASDFLYSSHLPNDQPSFLVVVSVASSSSSHGYHHGNASDKSHCPLPIISCSCFPRSLVLVVLTILPPSPLASPRPLAPLRDAHSTSPSCSSPPPPRCRWCSTTGRSRPRWRPPTAPRTRAAGRSMQSG